MHVCCHWDISGEGNGQFNAPTGVAVDAQDNILVADWGNSRIQVRNIFVKKLLWFIFCRSLTSMAPSYPMLIQVGVLCMDLRCVQTYKISFYWVWKHFQGIAITVDGNIVVADSGNHCIKIYKYLQ